MNITSSEFAIFTLVILVIYYVLPNQKAQNFFLLITSYIFLVSWNIQFALVFFVLTLINYSLAIYIQKKGKLKQGALYVGILANILTLAFLKYSSFFVPDAISLLARMGIDCGINSLSFILPIGLSFFTVQAISFLIDVNKGITKSFPSFIDFALFMAYFPRVVSGPIERSQLFIIKLQHKRNYNFQQSIESATLILQGLIRKIIIADLLFLIMPYNIFSEPGKFSSVELAVWLLAFAFALYNDFAGYSSIARGISGLFGIPLVENFNTPYLASNFTEFWQKWHISFSSWLREYIFMPLTRYFRKRKTTLNSIFSILLPPMITMFISALWHDVSWNMLVWGGMYGIILIYERIRTMRESEKQHDMPPSHPKYLSILGVFTFTVLAWVPFHTNIHATLDYWRGLFSPFSWYSTLMNIDFVKHQILNRYGLDVVILVGLSLIMDVSHLRFGELAVLRFPAPVQALILNLTIIGLIIAMMALSVPPPFVYQGY